MKDAVVRSERSERSYGFVVLYGFIFMEDAVVANEVS
jgi:hypothetical protein